MLPSIPRVKVEVLKAQLVVVEEVNLPRGEWKSEALDFYVAFGAPGAPRAIDARLARGRATARSSPRTEAGEPLVVDRAPASPGLGAPLIGRDSMAGVVVHVKRESLDPRVRAGQHGRASHPHGARSPGGGQPRRARRRRPSRRLPRHATHARPPLAHRRGRASPMPSRVEARLCGPDADPTPLAIVPAPHDATAPTPPIAPVLAVRHASDDLCIRFWTPP